MTKPITEARVAVTHNGKFHADEVFATALLTTLNPALEVQRSRDPGVIDAADIVYDVGWQYDPEAGRFDHHQDDERLKRENGLKRSALGLIWLHYGLEFCEGDERVADAIDQRLVIGVDARDNGQIHEVPSATPDYSISQIIESHNRLPADPAVAMVQFNKAVGIAAQILVQLREKVQAELVAEDYIRSCLKKSPDQRYVVLDRQVDMPEGLSRDDELLYVVFPEMTNNTWQVYAVREPGQAFTSKKSFPAEWAALQQEQLAAVSGVSDALFCHKNRFLAVAASREGALALLAKALD